MEAKWLQHPYLRLTLRFPNPFIDPLFMLASLLSKDNLFAISLFPYLGFLWFLTRSGRTPRLALIGFYVLLLFVVITIPAGIYAQTVLKTSLANVDPLHGGAEFFLTLSNVLVVLGFRQAVVKIQRSHTSSASATTQQSSKASDLS